MASKLFNNEAWTQEQYNEFKTNALNHGITRKTINYSDITIISDKLIEYKDTQFEMTENAFKALIKLIGLTNGAFDSIVKTLGDKITTSLIAAMKNAITKIPGKQTLCLLVDKKTLKIVNFTKNATGILSNNAFFTLFEDTLNNHEGMYIKNMCITQEGNVEISVLNDNWEFNVGGLNDEFFKSGLVFINTPNATIVNPFNERLVCTNGMISTESGMSLILKNSDANSVNGFYDTVRNLKGITNFENEFKERINRMMKTQASYGELLNVRKNAEYHINNMTDPTIRQSVEEFLPVTYVKQAFLAKQIDLNTVSNKDHAKIRTMLTVWELVNKLTDLSSHPFRYGFELKNGNQSVFQLQRSAGELAFKKQYDLELGFDQIF